jgi:hypothetical protein
VNLLLEIYNKIILNENVSIDSITDSIKNKYEVVLNYEGDPTHGVAPGIRVADIYAYGLSKAGNPVIRAYQPYGDTASSVPNWKFFRIDRITSWKPTYKLLTKPASGFNPNGDRSMSTVYSIADFSSETNYSNIENQNPKPKQKFKQVGFINNIDKVLSDRKKSKNKKKNISMPITTGETNNTNIQEPKIQGVSDTNKQSISEPKVDNNSSTSKEQNLELDNTNSIKTSGDNEIERMKDLSRRMDNARKIDLSKIPNR